jgi:hypothetical protein
MRRSLYFCRDGSRQPFLWPNTFSREHRKTLAQSRERTLPQTDLTYLKNAHNFFKELKPVHRT